MLRLPLLALLLVLLAAGAAAPARADDAAITIAPSDGGPARSVSLGALTGGFDVHGATYTVRDADGATSSVPVADGISLGALLAAAGLDADAFDYIAIAGSGGTAIVLRDDLGGADEGPPVVWSDAQGVHFLRPSTGADDANGADYVTLASGALAIALKRGEPLVPRIAVTTLRARPRERVGFSASLVGGAPLGPGREYQWYFDGTGTVRGANVSHRFARPGSYLVLLNVMRGGTSLGDPDSVVVRVVAPRAARPHDAHRADGGSGDGGAGDGGTGAGTGGGGHGGSAGGAGTGGAGDVGAAPAYRPPAPAAPAPSHLPASSHLQTPPPRPAGALVSGTLIASPSPVAAPAGGVRAARAAVAKGAASDGPLHVPVGVWVAVGLAGLLALGWALESRHTIPFWQP